MLTNDVESISKYAKAKSDLAKNNPGKYFLRAIMAGFFIVIACILSQVAAAVLYQSYPAFAKLTSSFLFSIAIILIVFVGGDLFTSNTLVLAMGVYNKACTVKDLLRVWIYSYIGNLIGTTFLGFLFYESGSSREILKEYYHSYVTAKLSAAPMELFIRGILCNFMVCLAIVIGVRLKTETGKIIVMFFVIMTFVLSGMEHCIANMGTFTIAALINGGLPMNLVATNLFYATIGNIVGGAVLLALPLKLMSAESY